jgi:PAS domain S-box-containing protein
MADGQIRVLAIEDSEADFRLLERALAKQLPSARPHRVSSNDELAAALVEGGWDVVLSDYVVPGMDFRGSLSVIHERAPRLPVILVSGSVGEENAVSLVKSGIGDFILKDNLVRLGATIERALKDADEQRARAEAEAALRTLVNAIPESAVLTDTEGRVLAANETMARRLGLLAGQMVGRALQELLPPEVAARRASHSEECIRTGEPARFLDERLGRTIDNYLYPIKDAKGQVRRLAVVGVDVTDSRLSEEKLKEQAALLDIVPDAILVKDLTNTVSYWSAGAERLYGWSAEEAMGRKTSALLFSAEHAAEADAAGTATIEKGEWRGDLHQKTKDGHELVVEGHWTLMRGGQGEPKGILSVNSDVTSRRAIEAQLLRAQRLESLGTLAGGIAHDLNNVLSPILMGVEGLSYKLDDAGTRGILDIIKTSAQRGANIVRQILNFARGMEGDFGELQLKHVLREIEAIMRETFPKSIALKTDIPGDLWPLRGDATQLHQVLMNLAVNARDAMPGGGALSLGAQNVHLDKTYAQMNIDARPIRYVVLRVDDTGTGMPPQILEKIFDPFFTTKAPGKGTGLGLSTVRSIVKSHGGFITVASEPGKGTTFRVHIPATEQGEGPRAEGADEGVPMGQGELVLVVDDEVSLRDITQEILQSFGYRVVTAGDGTEAVARFIERKGEITLVITDMMMPYMDGAATIRAIQKIDPRVRFMATSGLMAAEYAREAAGLGVRVFLAKPYTAETLLRALREELSRPTAAGR